MYSACISLQLYQKNLKCNLEIKTPRIGGVLEILNLQYKYDTLFMN